MIISSRVGEEAARPADEEQRHRREQNAAGHEVEEPGEPWVFRDVVFQDVGFQNTTFETPHSYQL